jgi:hypothetical protein
VRSTEWHAVYRMVCLWDMTMEPPPEQQSVGRLGLVRRGD